MARKTLADVPSDLALEAQQAGLMRLHLYFIGQTHARLTDLAGQFRAILTKHADEDGKLNDLGYLFTQRDMLAAWQEFYRGWATFFESARWQAGSLAYGGLAVMHRRQGEVIEKANERMSEAAIQRRGELLEDTEQDFDAVFKPQLAGVLDAANRRLYGDGLTLSQRIWRLDQNSWDAIRGILAQGVADGNSAWNVAKLLEEYLGAGRECPRWTSTRLYGRTKQDIADGDRTGLYTGEACAGQGVAYNALRLARNEFQVAHHMATDAQFAAMPWVEEEEINLSPSHPDIGCKCEKVVKEGKNFTNVYPKGKISLPIHVQCLCYKTAVLMADEEFVKRVRGWLDGTSPWGAMDDFASWLGVLPQNAFEISLAVGIANNLVTWLWGDEDDIEAVLGDQTVQLPFPEEF